MCDCPYPQFFQTRIVTAKKKHRCGECLGRIRPGEKYWYASGKHDDFWTAKTCLGCEALQRELAKTAHCCLLYGELFEEITNQFYKADYPPHVKTFMELRDANYEACDEWPTYKYQHPSPCS